MDLIWVVKNIFFSILEGSALGVPLVSTDGQ